MFSGKYDFETKLIDPVDDLFLHMVRIFIQYQKIGIPPDSPDRWSGHHSQRGRRWGPAQREASPGGGGSTRMTYDSTRPSQCGVFRLPRHGMTPSGNLMCTWNDLCPHEWASPTTLQSISQHLLGLWTCAIHIWNQMNELHIQGSSTFSKIKSETPTLHKNQQNVNNL